MTEASLCKLDAILFTPKQISGKVGWSNEDRPSSAFSFSAPLRLNDEPLNGLKLHGRAASDGPVGWLSLTLTAEEIPLERLSYLPHNPHTNKAPEWAPQNLHRQYFAARISRRYAWGNNRVLPHDKRREMASSIDENLVDAAQAIRYALKVMNIQGVVPEPEFQPTLGFAV
ncbi:hypothetical protein [Gluconobacter wancherniae]|uniref:hypothetical protein n=1 Tax=Gluconobacter wancherniae TaxID=1307955 RepID=UPI001B8C0F1A|nr:hypothetical protein [Gluconobacter wancherniae]MBS1088172.1 hypothetical protein [Gluconobacter wancherniae]